MPNHAYKNKLFLFAFCVLACFPTTILGRSDCEGTELRSFDFLVGDWKEVGSNGRKSISKSLNGCGLIETWELDGFSAILLRTYHNATKSWHLSFAAHDLVPQVWYGRFEEGNWYFYREWELNGVKRVSRTFWKRLGTDGFERIVEQSLDLGKTWKPHVNAKYRRVTPRKKGEF